MNHYHHTPEGKDPHLWHIARRRASFKKHLATYVIMNAFFWALWIFSDQRDYGRSGLPWPVWPMLGWGIGLTFHFLNAYVNTGASSVEKEYDKLKNQQ
ncbi:MAG TPA: 2TM domain-containing protein [Flavisolibacter sp.]